MFSTTHVLPRLAIVKCHDILERTRRWYSNSLFFGWQGIPSICAIKVVIRSKTSVRWLWLFMEKLKYRPRYLNDLPISTVGTKSWFNISLGKYWKEEVLYSKSRRFVNSDYHVCPRAPSRKVIPQNLVFIFKACYDCCILSELKPMDRGKRAYGKS